LGDLVGYFLFTWTVGLIGGFDDDRGGHTVSAWLNGCFNIPNAFDGDPILVVAVDELILQLADLIDKNTKFIRNIRHIFVAFLSPDR
jgi:hypothetical protein